MRGDFQQRRDVLEEYRPLALGGETDDYYRDFVEFEFTVIGVVERPGPLRIRPHIVRTSGCAIVDLHDPEWRRTA